MNRAAEIADDLGRSSTAVALANARDEVRGELQHPGTDETERRLARWLHAKLSNLGLDLYAEINRLAVEQAEAELALEDAADTAAAQMRARIDAAEPDPALTNIIRPDWSVPARVRRNFARSAADTNPDPRPAA